MDWIFMVQPTLRVPTSLVGGSSGAGIRTVLRQVPLASERHPHRVARLIRAHGLRGFTLDSKKRAATLKPGEPLARINPCDGRDCLQQIAMNDSLAAAAIGLIVGYLIARHTSEIEWILHTLIG
jgi:hypothetical protein